MSAILADLAEYLEMDRVTLLGELFSPCAQITEQS
jgi:hypothetical protein